MPEETETRCQEMTEKIPSYLKIDKPNRGLKKENREAVKQAIKLKLSNPDMTLAEIGKITHRTESVIRRTLRRYNIETRSLYDYKAMRADILAGTQDRILQSINEGDLSKATLQQKATSLGILYDKERLETGKSTQNISLSAIIQDIDRDMRQDKS